MSADVAWAAASTAHHVIAEINQQMPRTLGESFVHIDHFDAYVETDHPVHAYQGGTITDVHRKIAAHIAPLIDDGATLQMGIGAVPDAVLEALVDHKNLGIHTEMFSDGVVDLVERGVITGANKRLHPGLIVSSFVMGSQRLYDFVDDNPLVAMYPSHYTNAPLVIAQHEEMVAINSAIEVDITGQVCADSIGTRFFSGIGGQLDFIRGAARAPGGVPIIALPSTAQKGETSRIVTRLAPGAGVVTTRGDVYYVVTEHGVAALHGRSVRDRAEALIAVAAPQFRESLARDVWELYGFTVGH